MFEERHYWKYCREIKLFVKDQENILLLVMFKNETCDILLNIMNLLKSRVEIKSYLSFLKKILLKHMFRLR